MIPKRYAKFFIPGIFILVAALLLLASCSSGAATSTPPVKSTAPITTSTATITTTQPPGPTPTPSPSSTPAPVLLTKAQAEKDLVDNVIKPGSLTHETIAFTMAQPLAANTQVAAYAPSPLPDDVVSLPDLVPQTLTSTTWFFWVDDAPLARFSHPTRFVFVDAVTGAVTVTAQEWWPYINGQEVQQWVESPGRWNAANWAFNNVPSAEIPNANITADPGGASAGYNVITVSWLKPQPLSIPGKNDVPAGEGIVPVNGYAPGQNNAGFGQDIVHETQFGSNAQIPSYQPQGNTLKDIENAITAAQKGGAGDILFYWTGHGGRTASGASYLNFKGTAVTPKQLSDTFKKFPAAKFKVVIDACYGGGFSDTLMGTSNVVSFFSASSSTEVSYGGGFAGGGSFSDGFWQGLLDVLNSPDLQAQAKSDANGNPEFVGWLEVARERALVKDTQFQAGATHPVGHVATPPTPTPTPTPTFPPPAYNYSFVDNGYSSSVILKVSNMQPGWTATAILSGPGIVPTSKSATYNGGQTQTDGKVTITWDVNVVGDYSVTVTVTDSSGKTVGTFTGSEYVT